MITFRQKLKRHTAPAHQLLEAHERMQAYARPKTPLREYLITVKRLQLFWETHTPDGTGLPMQFYDFYQAYISALREDTNQDPPDQPPTPHHEIGFFYVLVGSSLGAKIILQNHRHSDLPDKHLQVLASDGTALWKTFVDRHLTGVDPTQEHLILQTSEQLFRELYQNISDI